MEQFTTVIWPVDNVDNISSIQAIDEAAKWLLKNEVVAFPTETVYGLGGNAFSEEAIKKIFEAKGRPNDNPLIIHIANLTQLSRVVSNIPEKARRLIDAFWPGPLTLVLPKGRQVAPSVTANLETVAVRMPSHPVAIRLIEKTDLPLAAPSANLSGKPSPTSARHVYEDLRGRVPGIIDGGLTGVGVESTVLDCTLDKFMILRPGGVTKEQLEEITGEEVLLDPALIESGQAPKSPGMKYTHYAPNAPLHIIEGSMEYFLKVINGYQNKGRKVGLLISDEFAAEIGDVGVIFPYGTKNNIQLIAQKLYEGLRFFNETEVDVILAEPVPDKGIGQAIMNRLEKAAGNSYFKER
jgi:L-threonylcarbamoyladenylate synthase